MLALQIVRYSDYQFRNNIMFVVLVCLVALIGMCIVLSNTVNDYDSYEYCIYIAIATGIFLFLHDAQVRGLI